MAANMQVVFSTRSFISRSVHVFYFLATVGTLFAFTSISVISFLGITWTKV